MVWRRPLLLHPATPPRAVYCHLHRHKPRLVPSPALQTRTHQRAAHCKTLYLILLLHSILLLMNFLKQGGIIMGQSFLGRIKVYNDQLFPPGGRQILETSADLGFILYLFILGVHIDLSLVKKVERYAVVIGASGFIVPIVIGFGAIYTISSTFDLDTAAKQSLPFMASLTAMSSFPVITSLLNDLNILNSEIGRIATLASLVSDICNYTVSLVLGAVVMYLISMKFAVIMSVVFAVVFLLIIIFILRPIIVLVSKRVPEGQQMKESHFVVVSVVVLMCALGAEVLGQPAGIGTFILGAVIPDVSGFGSSLVNKMDTMSTGLLVPAKFAISGFTLDLFSIRAVSGAAYGIVLLTCYVAKFVAVFIPSIYYKVPTRDAAALALVMCCKGAIEAALYITLFEDGVCTHLNFDFPLVFGNYQFTVPKDDLI